MNRSIVTQPPRRYIFSPQWTCFDIEIEATPAESIQTINQQILLANVLASGLGPVCPHCGRPTWRRNVRACVTAGRLIALHRDCEERMQERELIEVYDSLTGHTALGRGRFDLPEAVAAVDGGRQARQAVGV